MTQRDEAAALDDVARRGEAIYDSMQSSLLETVGAGRYIAIHVDSGDYAEGRSTSEATRRLRERHPADGRIFLRQIGDEPAYSLAARLLAGEMAVGQTK